MGHTAELWGAAGRTVAALCSPAPCRVLKLLLLLMLVLPASVSLVCLGRLCCAEGLAVISLLDDCTSALLGRGILIPYMATNHA